MGWIPVLIVAALAGASVLAFRWVNAAYDKAFAKRDDIGLENRLRLARAFPLAGAVMFGGIFLFIVVDQGLGWKSGFFSIVTHVIAFMAFWVAALMVPVALFKWFAQKCPHCARRMPPTSLMREEVTGQERVSKTVNDSVNVTNDYGQRVGSIEFKRQVGGVATHIRQTIRCDGCGGHWNETKTETKFAA